MIKKTIHIGPVFDGGMGSVIQSYIKLFNLPKENVWNSYKNGFVKSLPCLFVICFRILFRNGKNIICYHLHTANNGSLIRKLIIGLCLKLKNRKVVIHLHGAETQKYYKQRILVRALVKTLVKISDAVVCITEQMKNFIEKENLKCRVFVIPNLCETIAKNPIDLESRIGESRLVYAGRYGKRKGVYDLLKAFEKANFITSVSLDLYGDGEVEKVKKIVEKSTKKELIAVNGWTKHSEYIKKLPSYDFLVLPSYAETFPMSILEAMGFGIPVVSTYVSGIPEMIKDGQSGILFDAGDINKLADALEKLVNNRELLIKLGKNAWADAKARFLPEIILRKLEDMYKNICE